MWLDLDDPPLSAEATRTAVEAAVRDLAAAIGRPMEVLVVEGGLVMGQDACLITWMSGFQYPIDKLGFSQRRPWCVILIRRGAMGVVDTDELRCVAMHELGHALLKNTQHYRWHSAELNSFMAESRVKGGPCQVTADFLDRLPSP